MGTLTHFRIDMMRKRHGLVSFVETGTGDGAAVAQALTSGFLVVHSVEIMDELVEAARRKFKDTCAKIWRGDSRTVLPYVLRELPEGPTLFWLDAHFPGADYGMGDYADEQEVAKRLPLADEIALIHKHRPAARDVLLIDDARIYQPGPYSGGQLPPDWPPLRGVTRSLDFVRDAYRATHGVVVDYAQQGYVMVVPHHVY
jgi:hypothetical protein